ncbi:MAG: 5-formyltetrahydrofolate cyclo-ligase [Bdellovibrionaceae bacterium]|nr:5-formyltetrahydrofolate cyclo-ligase [Pseudobdellovibrionaceae bacterium]
MALSADKALLRRLFRSRLQLLRPWESEHLRSRLRENMDLFLSQVSGPIGAYIPLGEEADPGLFPVPKGLKVAFPRIVGEGLEFCLPQKIEDGPYGLRQPASFCDRVPLKSMGVILVPGVAYDLKGGRLGRGRGYYDRFLRGYHGRKVGVAFHCQLSLRPLPVENWDIKMNDLVTEQGIFSFTGENRWN